MAEEDQENENQEKEVSGAKKIIMFAGAGVLILALGIGGTVFFMGSKPDPDAEMAAEMEDEQMMEEEFMMESAIYHDLHPAFVANFSGDSKKKYMQVYVVAMAKEQSAIDNLKLHMPAVRNNVLMTLSSKTSEEVETVEGKEELRMEVLEAVRNTMAEKTGKESIEDLYFTKFVAQ